MIHGFPLIWFNNLNFLTVENQVLNLQISSGCPSHSAARVSCTTQPSHLSPATLIGKPYLNFALYSEHNRQIHSNTILTKRINNLHYMIHATTFLIHWRQCLSIEEPQISTCLHICAHATLLYFLLVYLLKCLPRALDTFFRPPISSV